MVDVTNTLAERGARYGEFKDQARLTQGIKRVLESGPNWANVPDNQREAMSMIASKMARIANGDHTYVDNWHDIVGYATLVEQELNVEAPLFAYDPQTQKATLVNTGGPVGSPIKG